MFPKPLGHNSQFRAEFSEVAKCTLNSRLCWLLPNAKKEDFLTNAGNSLTNSYQGNGIKGSLILSSFKKPKIVFCLLAPMTSATKDSWSGLQYKLGILAYRLAWNPIRKPLYTSEIIFQVEYHYTNSVHSWVILLITFLLLHPANHPPELYKPAEMKLPCQKQFEIFMSCD